MEFKEYFRDWLRVIDQDSMMKAVSWLQKQDINKICPSYYDIFKAFTMTTLRDCKVVIIGQDPYPQKGVATGLAFANKKGTMDLSPSLEVLKEACIDYTVPHGPIEFDCTLESWAKQGVLMLNTALTCEVNKPGSHTLLWHPFTSKLLSNMSRESTGIIYVLMGIHALAYKGFINDKSNDIIECNHPAYHARARIPMPNVFKEINKLLKEKYNTTIEWYKELNNNYEDERDESISENFFWPGPL